MRKTARTLGILIGIGVALLAGCGGGGSSSGPATSTLSFPLQTGFRALIVAGSSNNFTISGTCGGTATLTRGAATASTFEGLAGFSYVSTLTANLTNCTPATLAATATNYFDTNYAPLGSSTPAGEYTKFVTVPPPIPASVKVGDTANYATQTNYADSTKAVVTGQEFLSYVIEADTASTAIVNLISKSYDTSNQLLSTEQNRFRIAADGTLTVVSVDIQFSTTSTTHLLLTKS
jgi:hypothetical protein